MTEGVGWGVGLGVTISILAGMMTSLAGAAGTGGGGASKEDDDMHTVGTPVGRGEVDFCETSGKLIGGERSNPREDARHGLELTAVMTAIESVANYVPVTIIKTRNRAHCISQILSHTNFSIILFAIRLIFGVGAYGDHICVMDATAFIAIIIILDPAESTAADGRTFMLAIRKGPSERGEFELVIKSFHLVVDLGEAKAATIPHLHEGVGFARFAFVGLGGVAAVAWRSPAEDSIFLLEQSRENSPIVGLDGDSLPDLPTRVAL